MDPPFQGQFVVVGQGQAVPDSPQEAGRIVCRQGRRRTAADEDGVDEAVPQAPRLGGLAQFLDQAADVLVFDGLIHAILEEAAI